MRVLLASDSFKGSLDAETFCEVARGVLIEQNPAIQVDTCPMADGGEGTAAIVTRALGGDWIPHECEDPLGRPVKAHWGRLGDLAVVDLASASGLARLSECELRPMQASSFGTGQLIKAAIEAGCKQIVIGLGGSATVDGGAGILSALDFKLLDEQGLELERGGGSLGRIASIQPGSLASQISAIDWMAACDVNAPLLGSQGAAAVYGPQKGADANQVRILENALSSWARVLGHPELARDPGSGAAGGAGFGLAAGLGAELRPGFDWVADRVGFEARLARCDRVITGEGSLDAQSRHGKVTGEVVRRAAAAGVPCLVVAGQARIQLPPAEVIELVGQGISSLQARRDAASVLARRLTEWARLNIPLN